MACPIKFLLPILYCTFLFYACSSSKPVANINSYRLKHISYRIDNQAITHIVYGAKKDSFLRIGQPYNEDQLAQERERIFKLVQQYGIKDFNKQSITFLVESISDQRQFSITTVIDSH